jgi:hypothetical protein
MQGKGVETDWKFLGQLSMFSICVVLVLTTFLFACEMKEPKRTAPKYKQGDVVWLKPDSTRAVVVQWYSGQEQYEVHYYDRQHEAQSINVPEFGIYSIVNN